MQRVQYGDAGFAQHGQGIGREEQDGEHDGQTAADQRVIDAFGNGAIAIQGQHQDRRNDRLVDEHHALADEAPPDHHRDTQREQDGQRDGNHPGPEQPVCQGTHPDSQGDADDHLHGALRA
jgi:hypothetical protein